MKKTVVFNMNEKGSFREWGAKEGEKKDSLYSKNEALRYLISFPDAIKSSTGLYYLTPVFVTFINQ